MKLPIKIILISTAVLLMTALLVFVYRRHRFEQTTTVQASITLADQEYISANPFDLAQIKAISKFRSCAGHDFSGLGDAGVVEADRSMKNYFVPIDSLAGTIGRIKVFSPISGVVDHFELPHPGTGGVNGTQRGSGIWIKVPNLAVDVVLAHVDPAIPIAEGVSLTAGQLVGYANLGNDSSNDFDIVIQGLGRAEEYYSIFQHMTPEVLSQYAANGITLETVIISKDYRDARPCGYPGKNQEGNGKLTDYSLDFIELH